MRGIAKTWLGLVEVIIGCAAGYAATPDPAGHRFDGIAPRNIFGLKTPTPAITDREQIPTPQPKITLSGISTITGYKLALLKVQFPAKPGEPAREQSLMLTEGQRDGEIEVLQIDEKSGRVKVNSSGTITMLTFEKNGVKETAAPAPAPAALTTPTGQALPPLPSSNPNANSNVGYPGQKPIPTRFHLPLPKGPATASAPPTAPASISSTTLPATTNVPLPTVGPPPSVPPQPQRVVLQNQLTSEEQAVLLEVEREMARQSVTTRPPLAPQ